MASIKQLQVTFDCAHPEPLARFWCEVLGYELPPSAEGDPAWSACVDPSGTGPRLYFQRVPEGKIVKNRLHVDVRAGLGLVGAERLATLEAESARLVALGAVQIRLMVADDDNESCIVMQDIEGNEFCLD
nr:VOC family protein [Rhodococcus sp. (in: high G+C Gram-positive bacteria)]